MKSEGWGVKSEKKIGLRVEDWGLRVQEQVYSYRLAVGRKNQFSVKNLMKIPHTCILCKYGVFLYYESWDGNNY